MMIDDEEEETISKMLKVDSLQQSQYKQIGISSWRHFGDTMNQICQKQIQKWTSGTFLKH